MKLKGYISKRVLLRLAFTLVLAGCAWVFDYYHKGNIKITDEIQRSGSEKPADSFLFYYNPASQASLKLQLPRPSFKKLFSDPVNKLLLLHHSLRAYHFFKAEPLVVHRPLWHPQHPLVFTYHFSDNPDDKPHA